jgi:hypothetical protein
MPGQRHPKKTAKDELQPKERMMEDTCASCGTPKGKQISVACRDHGGIVKVIEYCECGAIVDYEGSRGRYASLYEAVVAEFDDGNMVTCS